MKEIDINGTISEITQTLSEYANDYSTIWFRGQPDYEHKLLPSVLRQGSQFKVIYNEQKMFAEFKRRFPNESVNHKTTYEWLGLMQHYGLPTRLLDWTTNLLVALYFCCKEEKDKDGSLFVFDPTNFKQYSNEFIEMQVTVKNIDDFYHKIIFDKSHILNDDTILNGDSIGSIKENLRLYSNYTGLSKKRPNTNPFWELKLKVNMTDENGDDFQNIYTDILKEFSNIVPFNPPHINSRIKQQHGCFTLHGGMYIDGNEFIAVIPMDEYSDSANSLIKIKILADNKKSLLEELKYMGIREATLFPEMEYQSAEIKTMYSNKDFYER